MIEQNTLTPPGQRKTTAISPPQKAKLTRNQSNGDPTLNHSNDIHCCEPTSEAAELVMPSANSWQLWQRGIDWPVVVWIGLVHVLALVAPFYFSWQALIACA